MAATNTAEYASLARAIAILIDARARCLKTGNDYATNHRENLDAIAKDLLPSGSGIDSGTKIDLDRSTGDTLIFTTSFHHMNEHGYDGWTDHTIRVRASLVLGLDIRVTGRDRNDIKDYLGETFAYILGCRCKATYDVASEVTSWELI